MSGSMSLVYGKPAYVALAAGIFAGFFLLFSLLDEYLFLAPILTYYIPPDGGLNFALSVAIATLLAIVISTNIFVFGRTNINLRSSSSWISGSFVAAATGACGCTSLGFAVISTFGGAGILASSFVTNYQMPLKIASLAILLAAYYAARRNVIRRCAFKTGG